MSDDDPDQLDLLWLTRGEGIDVDQVVADIIDDAEWVDPVPQFEDLVAQWPTCPELWVPRSPCRVHPWQALRAGHGRGGGVARPSGNDKR
ncbi:hypothetical protein [Gordonia sp. (in: high G+C Gram-positive bacteria)]|uniref:hypothetical protein n=1 Tax=Gordonia sp. (in: high G+C Gram-positive bacteria) TaxID=84139 RepID=UPI00262386F9|nr:hypothetical protein [Gordonia sp. (in: high G+C Gram-positive bacteria)]HMS73901.1 hypothetical protein [Gordonia sp. (in: high G+C Gram-positive bacteria)]